MLLFYLSIMIEGKRRSKRTTQKLRPHCPRGVKLYVVDSGYGDNSAKPTYDNTSRNLVANDTNSLDSVVKSSECQNNKNRFQGNQWTKENMEHAIGDVEYNCFSIRGAKKKWRIPISSLLYWLVGLITTKTKGSPMIHSLEEQLEVVEWCKDLAQLSHGFGGNLVEVTCNSHLPKRPNPLKNGLPGRSWWVGFHKCHPYLTIRTTKDLDRDREVML